LKKYGKGTFVILKEKVFLNKLSKFWPIIRSSKAPRSTRLAAISMAFVFPVEKILNLKG
jgi:hypothetical protein